MEDIWPSSIAPNISVQYYNNITKYNDIIGYPAVRYTLIAFHIVLSLLAIIGNAVVLLVVYKRRSLRQNPTVIFIINLAFVDLVQCSLYRPLQLVELFLPFTADGLHNYQYRDTYCKTMSFFQCMFAGVGFHTIVTISQERLFLIVYPLKAKHWFSTSRARKLLVLIWAVSAMCIIPVPIMFARIIEVTITGSVIKYCGLFKGGVSGFVYFISMLIIYFLLPLIIISVSYSRIFCVLYHRPKNLDAVHEKKEFQSLRKRRGLAKMMVAVAVIFMLCWGPHFIFYVYAGLGGKIPANGFFASAILDILPIISSCMNPFVYTINSRTFRSGLTTLIQRSSTRRSHSESMYNTFASPFYRTSTIETGRKQSLIGNREKGDAVI